MKRKTLAVSLSAILAASMLFGCGSNSKSGDTKSSSDNGSASASAADASNAGSDASGSGIQYDGDDVTITIGIHMVIPRKRFLWIPLFLSLKNSIPIFMLML